MGSILLVVAGLAVLVVGAEVMVRGATRLAARLGISPIVVGLTIISIGTSVPELAVGIDAGLRGAGALAVGNIAGTNIVNLLLILGLSAAIRPLLLQKQTLRVDLPMMAIAAVALWLMAIGGALSSFEGVLLLLGAVTYILVIIRVSQRGAAKLVTEKARGHAAKALPRTPATVAIDLVWVIAGIAVIVLGADWLVDGAVAMAQALAVSDALIGLTIVAIGTSAPELVTTVVSTIRGQRDLAVGNLIGSSVFNITFILGATMVVVPGGLPVTPELVWVDLPLMAAVTLVCVPVFLSGRRVSRLEGALFVVAYLVYLTYLIVARG